MAETEIKSINGRPIADTTARKNKADKTGWGANKYIGTDENGNLVEKDLPETGTGGIPQETDPTVPSWAKQPEKPTYTKTEIGLDNVDNVRQYSTSNPPPYPVIVIPYGDTTYSFAELHEKASSGVVIGVYNSNAYTAWMYAYDNDTIRFDSYTATMRTIISYGSDGTWETRRLTAGSLVKEFYYNQNVSFDDILTEADGGDTIFLYNVPSVDGITGTTGVFAGIDNPTKTAVFIADIANGKRVICKLIDTTWSYEVEDKLTAAIIETALGYTPANANDVPAVDNTLKVTGAAADAAKVGEEISNLSEAIADLSENVHDVIDEITTKEVESTEVDIFPSTGFGFKVGGDGYSQYFDIVGGNVYRLAFTECTYDGTGVAVELKIECYDAEKNVVADGASVGANKFGFVNIVTGNVGGTQLLVKSYPMGGYRDIEFTENVRYIRFIINNTTSAVINDRMPIGWSFTGQEEILAYKVKLPQVMTSNNLFFKGTATTAETVYLGKTSDGVEMYGWYLTSVGTPASAVSGSGIDSSSAPIPVTGGKVYRKLEAVTCNIFDADDMYISSVGMPDKVFTTPENAAYVRLGFASTNRNNMQFVEGDKEIAYDDAAYMIPFYASEQHTRITKLLNRGGLTWNYSGEYIRTIADEANKYVAPDRETFVFVTDTHCHETNTYIGSIVAEISKYVPVDCVVHGGDIIDGLSAPAKELRTLSDFVRNLNESRVPVVYCKGNHDDNQIYARQYDRAAELYIKNLELFNRTNAFCGGRVNRGGDDKMYMYIDNDRTKVRLIVLNTFDVSEDETDGVRTEDAKTLKLSTEQMQWLAGTALNFTNKADKNEWAAVIISHYIPTEMVRGIISAYKKGVQFGYNGVTGEFAEQGAMEFIGFIHGDDHYDSLQTTTYGTANFCRITTLNASLARDNVSVPTADNGILMPPVKEFAAEDETAFDIVTIDRASKLIYLTRYGARSYVYNADTNEFDKIAARTRVIDYDTISYKVLTE